MSVSASNLPSAATSCATPTSVANPLTLIMKLKSPEAFQQASALIGQIQSLPPDKNPIWVALNKLANVHFARFVFLGETQLAIITTYDGTFEAYINEFIDAIGDVFNQLMQFMDGAPPLPVQQNRDAFLAYVKANDLRCIEPFYSAYPTATVLDIQAALALAPQS